MEEKDQIVDVPEPQIMEGILEASQITPKKHISERILPVLRLQEENVEVIQRSVEGIIHQEHILERTQIVDIPVPQMLDEFQECISERMHEQGVDEPVCQTVDQPGDQACRVPTDSIHRQECCRYACGDAVTGPSSSDFVEDSGSPAGAIRRRSYGGTDDMRQVACPKCGCLTTCVENVTSTATSENVPHASGMRAQDAWRLQAARLPREARRRRGRGRHWW